MGGKARDLGGVRVASRGEGKSIVERVGGGDGSRSRGHASGRAAAGGTVPPVRRLERRGRRGGGRDGTHAGAGGGAGVAEGGRAGLVFRVLFNVLLRNYIA